MSLGINVTIPEGIVLAADSRQTYRNQKDMARQGLELLDLKEEPTRVVFHFKNQQGQVQEAVAAPDGLQFILAGYNKDRSSEVYMVYVPGATDQARDSSKQGKEFGAGWIGQTDVVTRIVLGFDPRLQGIPLVREAAAKIGEPAVQQQLRGMESVSYTHLRAHETRHDLVCRLLLEKKK